MPLSLPNLDDLSYEDLIDQALARIPGHDPRWTNHNPTDPGITLIELFAWLAEMLIYRTNRVPDQHLSTFLKLLNEPGWQPSQDLDEAVRESVVGLRQRYRAVTCQDYEALAIEASPDVARAKCVPRRYLGAGTEADRTRPRPGYVSLIILPHSDDPAPQPSEELRQVVWDDLDPRRVLTTRLHVAGPIYAPVSAEVLIARRADMPEDELLDRVVAALEDFLHPLEGGPEGGGWPFGRDVYVSELYQLLEAIPGVDYIPDVALFSECTPEDIRCVPAEPTWHDNGDLVGLSLAEHHLPQARFAESLFSLNLELQADLDRGGSVSEGLQGAFEDNGVTLSSHATVRIVDKGARWLISDRDNNRVYRVRLEENGLRVYGLRGIVTSAAFVTVRVRIEATPAESIKPSAVRRAVKSALRRFFHPLHGGPDGSAAREITLESLRSLVQNLDEVENVIALDLVADPSRLLRDEAGTVTGLRVEAGELVDVQVNIIVSAD